MRLYESHGRISVVGHKETRRKDYWDKSGKIWEQQGKCSKYLSNFGFLASECAFYLNRVPTTRNLGGSRPHHQTQNAKRADVHFTGPITGKLPEHDFAWPNSPTQGFPPVLVIQQSREGGSVPSSSKVQLPRGVRAASTSRSLGQWSGMPNVSIARWWWQYRP